jgi:hypothetical protein
VVIPVLVSSVSPFVGYLTTTCCFAVAILVFIAGSGRYVKMAPQGKNNLDVVLISCKAVFSASQIKWKKMTLCIPMYRGLSKQKQSNGGAYPDVIVSSITQLLSVIPVTLLVLPFNIIYSQCVAVWALLCVVVTALRLTSSALSRMVNVFVLQGLVMAPAGFIDASWMSNFDAFSVLVVGLFVSAWLYPALEKVRARARGRIDHDRRGSVEQTAVLERAEHANRTLGLASLLSREHSATWLCTSRASS